MLSEKVRSQDLSDRDFAVFALAIKCLEAVLQVDLYALVMCDQRGVYLSFMEGRQVETIDALEQCDYAKLRLLQQEYMP